MWKRITHLPLNGCQKVKYKIQYYIIILSRITLQVYWQKQAYVQTYISITLWKPNDLLQRANIQPQIYNASKS